MLTPADVEALRALLGRAPEPGNMQRPNAVSAFFHRWCEWQAEAHQFRAWLERALVEHPVAAHRNAAAPIGRERKRRAAASAFPRRPSPAEVRAVVAEMTAEYGRRPPSSGEIVAALRARSGCSRATAYRALQAVERGAERARRKLVVFS